MKKLLVLLIVTFLGFTGQAQEESAYVDSIKNVETEMVNLLDSLQRHAESCIEYLSQEHGTDKYSLISLPKMLDINTFLSVELNTLAKKRLSFLEKLKEERSAIFFESIKDEKNWKIYEVQKPKKPEIYK